MDCKSSNATVSLTRCDDVGFNKKINAKDTVENSKTVEVKRSLRLSKKRISQDELVSNNNQSDTNKKKIKKRKCNNTKQEETISNKICLKKANNQISGSVKSTKNNLTKSDTRKVSRVQYSPNTTVDNTMTLPVKTTQKTLRNKISTKCSSIKNMSVASNAYKIYVSDSSDDGIGFVECNRKRGRPSSTPKINILNKTAKQKTKNPVINIEKQQNINKSESSEMLDGNVLSPASNNKSSEVEYRWDEDNLSTFVEPNDESCSVDVAADQLETTLAATSKELSVSEVITVDDPRTYSRTIERQIHQFSKRFSIPFQTLKNILIKEPLSIFREKYSKSITPSMITVSPIIVDIATRESDNHEKDISNIRYKVEPIRDTEAYETTNLKDCMYELSNIMPSWSLCIVSNPSRYVINQMSIDAYGVPVVNKSIVLDRYFRASVYINQCLQFKYGKRYHTATEIINLIKELNTL